MIDLLLKLAERRRYRKAHPCISCEYVDCVGNYGPCSSCVNRSNWKKISEESLKVRILKKQELSGGSEK